jgi:protein SCO1/2
MAAAAWHALRCLTPLLALSLTASLDGAAGAARPITAADLAQALRSHFPNVPLQTQDGKTVRFYDDLVKDKVVLIQLVSTDCSKFCSTITANLVQVQRELLRQLGDRVGMLSLTVNPELDRPQALRLYASRYGVQPGWHFLTGARADVDLIRKRLDIYDPDERRTEHLAVLTVGNEAQGQWVAIPALSSPREIVRCARRMLGEPAAGLRPS